MIDVDSLMKGQDYYELKDSYILFICTYEPFKDSDGRPYGLPCYTFRNGCSENPEVDLNDKCLKVIYNSSAYEKADDEKIRGFLRYISTNEPGEDDFSRRLCAQVEQIKQNEKFRSDYAAMNLHDRDITRRAKNEGRQEKAEEAARSFYANGVSIELIAKSLKMTIEEVKEIVKDTVVTA